MDEIAHLQMLSRDNIGLLWMTLHIYFRMNTCVSIHIWYVSSMLVDVNSFSIPLFIALFVA